VLTPVVRRLLEEHGLDEDGVVGSGRDGRVTRADVLAAAAQRQAEPSNGHRTAPAAPAPPATPADLTSADLAARLVPSTAPLADDDEVLDLSRARLATAEHMMRSLATSAHALVATAVDYVDVDRVRREAGLSYLPFVARAVVEALRNRPHLNASVGDGQLIVHRAVHLGIAVDVEEEALMVPVVHDADRLRLPALAEAIADVAARTRRRRVTTGELTGGTFTITNVGASGTLVTAPIINQPQVAILSTDGVKMQPVAIRAAGGDWATAVHPVGNLCLSFDHRAVDGAYAAAFLADVRDLLETRDWTEEVRRP
jgi:2-oxoglutarate dehydrogenase E2 component (dihydrolipoamide succinyltransferase)